MLSESPESSFYRKEAVEHYLAGDSAARVADISPRWTWLALGSVSLVILGALLASFVMETEVVGRARGLLRPDGGVHVLTAGVNGTVIEVLARSGEHLSAEAPFVRLNSSDLQAQLLEAERHLQLIEADYQSYARRQAAGLEDERKLLQARIGTLTDQAASFAQSTRVFERKLTATRQLRENDLVSSLATDDAEEALAQIRRQHSGVQLQLEQTRQELSLLDSRRRDLDWETVRELQAARSRVEALRQALRQTTIRVPRSGVVEAISVKPGDVVDRGRVLGELSPSDTDLQVTAFLPEQDRAFVKAGDKVRLELDQLPHLEFGSIEGHIQRVATVLASPQETADAAANGLSLTTATYRMEVQFERRSLERLGFPLRSGMLVSVRYTLRKQKVLTLVLGPLRKWLE